MQAKRYQLVESSYAERSVKRQSAMPSQHGIFGWDLTDSVLKRRPRM